MVDKSARRALAESLRHLASGVITNDEFENRIPRSKDPAIGQIRRGAWYLYDDLNEHRLVGSFRLPPENREDVARWILFLASDREYEWPQLNGVIWFVVFWLNLLTLGVVGKLLRIRMRRAGDETVWPFRTQSEYQAALQQPAFRPIGA